MHTPTIRDIPASARAEIDRRLAEITEVHGVQIVLAVESGSRAWGFASPDSDFDVRFIYAHPRDWYLSLSEGRDVIETPIEGDMDVNGWDIRKALRLALSSNPILIEWLTSPIVYSETPKASALRSFAVGARSRRALIRHYLGLAQNSWERDFKDGRDDVALKKYFYVIRPALALAWLHSRPGAPPMTLADIIDGLSLDAELREIIERLRAQKSKTHELGRGQRVRSIDSFVTSQLHWARSELATLPNDRDPAVEDRADALFRALIN